MSTPIARPRQRALRQDAIRNEQALINAVGELLKQDPAMANMAAVAERAGLSLATAYRYFPTLDHLHRRFMLSVIERLSESIEGLTSTGTQRFEDILRRWLVVVAEYGPAMVLVRSRDGFLTRLAAGEAHTTALDKIWGSAIRQMLHDNGVAEDQYPFALTLHNSLVNSREVLDLRTATGMTDDELVAHYSSIYRAALNGLKRAIDSTQSDRPE
ncbi:TetR/AcrR family transcriptional regulator [Mycolicibacterium sp. S2-37]|uniref:TetR/AcrR family transcriptional regulator n=1 Tax=Mycolicibacterium sp. S2-37 TaxID=2810297 RepID=UPI001A9400E5|nr:TetR/AcrR family transcriptional regulator [Mycolicibacterium sp. S2-37]MBO0680885.1 TetR/AcrR family transcriptional regulator [Mycolicibacterium sp. S2-37]